MTVGHLSDLHESDDSRRRGRLAVGGDHVLVLGEPAVEVVGLSPGVGPGAAMDARHLVLCELTLDRVDSAHTSASSTALGKGKGKGKGKGAEQSVVDESRMKEWAGEHSHSYLYMVDCTFLDAA